jgi:hypothetical protein
MALLSEYAPLVHERSLEQGKTIEIGELLESVINQQLECGQCFTKQPRDGKYLPR